MTANVEHSIRNFIVEQFVYDDGIAQSLTQHSALIDDGVVDSFGVFMIIEFVETEYGIKIDDEDVTPANIGTINGIARLVESKIGMPNVSAG